MIKNFSELIQAVIERENKTIAIAAAHIESAITAAVLARKKNIADTLLVGNKSKIEALLSSLDANIEDYRIIDTGDDLALAAQTCVDYVNKGEVHAIMKGICDTGTLLKAVLKKENNLRTGNVMSDTLVFETDQKLMMMGDGGFIPAPSLKDKVSIVKNCVKVAHSLGYSNPNVAMLTHSEKVNPKIQSTVDAAEVAKMNENGEITGCTVAGPLALDIAIMEEAARIKGITSPVAGNADVLIVPSIEAGNIFGKSLMFYCKFPTANIVLGAKVPILIASRTANEETKMRTMALGSICS